MTQRDDIAIRVRELAKRFEIYARPADLLRELITRRSRHTECWALRDVSFDVRRGEVVGIVGRNGAGKSTLLKIITGTLEATRGSAQVNGRVSAVLELGTGFHSEYTGRENIRMGGLCLGMTRQQVDQKMQWVIDFSELAPVIDQPLKTYSTGMQARLAFATAMCVEPDIMIVDEALSVGDVRFQRKCFNKFEELRAAGCTILFVSHSTEAVNTICDRAIYLDRGVMVAQGPAKTVTDLYLRDLLGQEQAAPASAPPPAPTDTAAQELRYGTREAEIVEIDLLDEHGRSMRQFVSGQNGTIRARVACHAPSIEGLNVGIGITTTQGVRLFAINPVLARQRSPALTFGDHLDVSVDLTLWLGPGDYFVTVGAWNLGRTGHLDRRVDAIHFNVLGDAPVSASLVNLQPRYRMALTSPAASEEAVA